MRKHAKYTYQSQFLEMFGNPQTCSSGVVGKDVFEFASGKALTKENLNPEYEYNCYGGNGVTGKSNDYLVEASTIVIGRVGEYCGGIHLTNPYSWITDNAIYLKKYDSRYELEFIEYLFKAMDFHRFASESGQPKITQSPLIESVYPLPSKDEQIAFLIIKRQADKSKFDGFKSQFLEMFGNAKRTPLVDVCLKSGEYGSNSPADDYDGNIRYVRITDITDEGNLNNLLVSPRKIEEKYLLVKDDLLFARTGNTVGKTYLHNEGKMVFAGYLIRYKLNKNIVLPQFAFAYTHTNDYYVWVEKTKKIGAQPNISATQYDEMPIPTPPLSEQKAFVSIAEQADKSKFDGFKSQFLEMFGNAKRTPLVDVCLKSGEYGSNSPADDYDGNIRYVRITDITDEGNLNNLLVSPRKIEEKYLLVKDDLLFARTGNTVGKTYLHNEGKMVFAGYLIRYKLNKNIVLPQFAFAYTHTNDYYVWVEKTKKIGAQPNISATQYDEMPIPTPPLSEQKAFVSIAEQADKSKYYELN